MPCIAGTDSTGRSISWLFIRHEPMSNSCMHACHSDRMNKHRVRWGVTLTHTHTYVLLGWSCAFRFSSGTVCRSISSPQQRPRRTGRDSHCAASLKRSCRSRARKRASAGIAICKVAANRPAGTIPSGAVKMQAREEPTPRRHASKGRPIHPLPCWRPGGGSIWWDAGVTAHLG